MSFGDIRETFIPGLMMMSTSRDIHLNLSVQTQHPTIRVNERILETQVWIRQDTPALSLLHSYRGEELVANAISDLVGANKLRPPNELA